MYVAGGMVYGYATVSRLLPTLVQEDATIITIISSCVRANKMGKSCSLGLIINKMSSIMDLRSLEYFIQTANSLSFTQAAKACFVSSRRLSKDRKIRGRTWLSAVRSQ